MYLVKLKQKKQCVQRLKCNKQATNEVFTEYEGKAGKDLPNVLEVERQQ